MKPLLRGDRLHLEDLVFRARFCGRMQGDRRPRIDVAQFAVTIRFLVRTYNSDDKRHPYEFGQASRMHLVHEIRAIDLYRARADAEVEGNLLVGLAGHEPAQHVALALRCV